MSHHPHHGIQTSTVVEVGAGLLIGSMISERQQKTGESYGRAAVGTLGEFAAWMVGIVVALFTLGALWYMVSLFSMHPFITIGFLLVFVGVPATILWWSWRKTAGPVATVPAAAPERALEDYPVTIAAHTPPFTSRIQRYPARDNVAPRR